MTNTLTISREQFELGFDYVDGKHIPTVKISLSPCHPDDNSAWEARNMLAERIKALLAAPAVERQEPVGYVLAKQTAVDVPGQDRKELGYTVFDGIGVFHSHEEVHAAIAELGLPLGWVSMTVDQLLPGYMMPADTSPPAPVAVNAEFFAAFERVLLLFAPHDLASMQVLTDARACLDKVKEMNR